MTIASSDVGDGAGRPIRVGRFVEWVPICREVECGLGTLRESMRLVHVDHGVRLLTGKSRADFTQRMDGFSQSRVSALDVEALSGFVFKKDSPSCGLEKPLNAKEILERQDLKEGFALHCSGPSATR